MQETIYSGKWGTRYDRCPTCSQEMLAQDEWDDDQGWVKLLPRCYHCRPICESDPDAPMQAIFEWMNEVPEDDGE